MRNQVPITICTFLILILLSNCERRAKMYYYPKSSVIEILDNKIILNEVLYEMQDTTNISASVEIKKISSNSYSIENKEIKNKPVILTIECIVEDGGNKYYYLDISKAQWKDSVISIFESLPH